MAGPELKGILVALPTPFTAGGGAIDAAALRAHVDRLVAAGVHGLVPGGSTGEFPALDAGERRQLVEETVAAAKGRVPVVAGVGGLSTAASASAAREAAAAGADALMVVPPFYDAPSAAQVRELLREVGEAAPGLPLVYYNIPSATGVKLSPEQLAGLAEVPGVRYLKDTSGDGPALTELLVRHAGSITAFNGWDTLTFYGLAAGAKGSVWGAANVLPELAVELWAALAEEGNLARARDLWSRIYPVCRFLESHNYAAAVKTGMELRGWPTGGLRRPFALLEGEHRDELAGLLRDAGVPVV